MQLLFKFASIVPTHGFMLTRIRLDFYPVYADVPELEDAQTTSIFGESLQITATTALKIADGRC